jgi:hypothetical protein
MGEVAVIERVLPTLTATSLTKPTIASRRLMRVRIAAMKVG